MNTNLPRHNIGALCSQISFDKASGAAHMFNIQNVFFTHQIPVTLSNFVIVNQWTNAQGDFIQHTELFSPTGILVAERKNQFKMSLSAPLLPHWCIDSFTMSLTLKETGIYYATISIGRVGENMESVCNIPFECRIITHNPQKKN